MYRSRSELMLVCLIKNSQITLTISLPPYLTVMNILFSLIALLNRSGKKVFQLFLNGVRIIVFQSLNCTGIYCHLPLSFKRTIITFLFDNYCAMETVN